MEHGVYENPLRFFQDHIFLIATGWLCIIGLIHLQKPPERKVEELGAVFHSTTDVQTELYTGRGGGDAERPKMAVFSIMEEHGLEMSFLNIMKRPVEPKVCGAFCQDCFLPRWSPGWVMFFGHIQTNTFLRRWTLMSQLSKPS